MKLHVIPVKKVKGRVVATMAFAVVKINTCKKNYKINMPLRKKLTKMKRKHNASKRKKRGRRHRGQYLP